MSTAGIWLNSKPEVKFQYDGSSGEFNGVSSQSYVSHCRVLPPDKFNGMSFQSHVLLWRVGLLTVGEFTVIISQPHTALHGVRIPSAIFKIVFRHIFFVLMQFRFDELRLSYRLRYSCVDSNLLVWSTASHIYALLNVLFCLFYARCISVVGLGLHVADTKPLTSGAGKPSACYPSVRCHNRLCNKEVVTRTVRATEARLHCRF